MTLQQPKIKIPTWKIALYGLLVLGFIVSYVLYREISLLLLAPIGFIIYVVESYKSLRQFGNWSNLSKKEKFDAVLSLTVLIVIAAIIALILYAILSMR